MLQGDVRWVCTYSNGAFVVKRSREQRRSVEPPCVSLTRGVTLTAAITAATVATTSKNISGATCLLACVLVCVMRRCNVVAKDVNDHVGW